MPLDASLVGHRLGAIETSIDPRWTMAYAAGVGDDRPALHDTTRALLVHPLYPVSPEWELFTQVRSTPDSIAFEELVTGVHLHHLVEHHRPLRPGMEVELSATSASVGRHRAGALQTIRFDAGDADGPVWTTWFTTLFRGVELTGDPAGDPPPTPGAPASHDQAGARTAPLLERTLEVGALDAQRYTACARIWNPIHTDVAVARSVGLDAPILHGTATLARAVSTVVDLCDLDLGAVRTVGGRFAATVGMPSTLTVSVVQRSDRGCRFEVLNDVGRRAVADGWVGGGLSPSVGVRLPRA